METLFQSCGPVDWCRFWETLFEAAAPVLVAALVGLFGLAIRWRFYHKQQKRLHALALCRRKGVKLRNNGLDTKLVSPALDKWKAKIKEWKNDLFETAKRFSPVEAERLDTLDWMPFFKFDGITDPDHLQLLGDVNETLRRLQQLLEERVRPNFTP